MMPHEPAVDSRVTCAGTPGTCYSLRETLLALLVQAPARRRTCRPASGAPSRVHAALTALAFVLASLFGIVHEATTQHVRCAQHGELVDSGAAGVRAERLERGELRGPAMRAGAGSRVASHGHEHCALASVTRAARVLSSAPALVVVPVAVSRLVVAALPPVAVADRALYRTAPKTSPPA